MPGADASQFIQLKKASANYRGPPRSDLKSTNRLTHYVTPLSNASNEEKFLPSLTLKNTRPIILGRINVDTFSKKNPSNQNCS
jgi:hypothetical protein